MYGQALIFYGTTSQVTHMAANVSHSKAQPET